jgi:DNA-binding transcriptional LysR family regulator
MRHQLTFRLIDAVAREGSIRKAANVMSITPSAVNRRLLALEDELEVQLFERTTKGMRLSTAGELVIEHARRQLADMERVRSVIEDLKGGRWGSIKIATNSDFVPSNLSSAIAEYRKEHKAVTFQLTQYQNDMMANLLEAYDIDIAIMVNYPTNPAFSIIAAAAVNLHAVLVKNHPLAEKTELRIHELDYFPLVMPAAGSLRDIIKQASIRHNISLNPMLETDYVYGKHDIIQNDAIGFALAYPGEVSNDKAGLIQIPLSRRDFPQNHVQALQLKGRAQSVAVNRFNEALTLDFAKHSGDV